MAGNLISGIADTHYAIIDVPSGDFICESPLEGIFGVAYSWLNDVQILPTDGSVTTAADLIVSGCPDDNPKAVTCDGNVEQTTLPSPIEIALAETVDSGYNAAQAFGLYVDYEATKNSPMGQVIAGQGAYFGGDMALNNPYYNAGTPQVSLLCVK